MEMCNPNKLKPWTWDSTGYVIRNTFQIYWRPGKLNYANYWTKHHPESHHRNMRKEFLTPHIILEMLRKEQKRYAACAAWKSDHNDGSWRGCDDLSLARPDPWSKDRLQSQAPNDSWSVVALSNGRSAQKQSLYYFANWLTITKLVLIQ